MPQQQQVHKITRHIPSIMLSFVLSGLPTHCD